ncbi:hypothetical protein AAZX31_15G225900 [Glycine max]|nr:hypothetical protein GYH30_043319 [Glycine max]
MKKKTSGHHGLGHFSKQAFFVQCKVHTDFHKSECNTYCSDCMNGALCSDCLASNREHKAIQVATHQRRKHPSNSGFTFSKWLSRPDHGKRSKETAGTRIYHYKLETKTTQERLIYGRNLGLTFSRNTRE